MLLERDCVRSTSRSTPTSGGHPIPHPCQAAAAGLRHSRGPALRRWKLQQLGDAPNAQVLRQLFLRHGFKLRQDERIARGLLLHPL